MSIPFLQVCARLQLPPVATYAGVCLWNFRTLFPDEPLDSLENLATLTTFTGSLDESWFYLVSVAIEARGARLIPLLLDAVAAARRDEAKTVAAALQAFAERIDSIGSLLHRMDENCDPHVFYHRIRPFLAGSKNMAEAGLPRGVVYEDGTGTEPYRQYSGGSNAQSSLIQFFDIMLGVAHRPTGEGPVDPSPDEVRREPVSHPNAPGSTLPTASDSSATPAGAPAPPNSFIHEMRAYMPGPHARFLAEAAAVTNIRPYVLSRSEGRDRDTTLCLSFDAAVACLRGLRDRHMRLVTRYIILPSRANRDAERRSISPRAAPMPSVQETAMMGGSPPPRGRVDIKRSGGKRGTGGTALTTFLKQARDETGAGAVDAWARRLLGSSAPLISRKGVELGKVGEHADGVVEIVGLAGTWGVDEGEGGLCHW